MIGIRTVAVSLALVAAVAWSASAQSPTVLNAAVGSNMNHVPSFVGVEKGIFLKHGIDRRPDVVERYVIGMAEATWYTRKNRDEAADISTRWVPGLDAAVAKTALANMVFDARITPRTVAAWEENNRILVEQKKMRAPLPWQQGIELRFIEKVMKSHPQFFADLPK